MLTKSAFTTIQWKSLMRLFDIHPPPNLNVDRSHSESSYAAVSLITHLAMSNTYSSQRDFESGPWEEKSETRRNPAIEQSGERSSAWRNPVRYSSSRAWGNLTRSSEQIGAESDACDHEVCHETKLEGESIKKIAQVNRSSVEKHRGRQLSLPRCHSRKEGNDEVRDGAQVPRRSVNLRRLRWKSSGVVSTAGGDFLLEDDHFESFKTGTWAMVIQIDSVLAKIHQVKRTFFSESGKCVEGSSTWKAPGTVEDKWMENCREGW